MSEANENKPTGSPASNSYRELVAHFVYRDELPRRTGCGIGQSPRRSHMDTAVVLAPEHYDALLQCRDDLNELIETLRELADFSIDDPNYRYVDRAKAARRAAYELLKKLEGPR